MARTPLLICSQTIAARGDENIIIRFSGEMPAAGPKHLPDEVNIYIYVCVYSLGVRGGEREECIFPARLKINLPSRGQVANAARFEEMPKVL